MADSTELAKTALREMRERKNNAVAIYTRATDEPLPATSPFAVLLNSGLTVRIPYYNPR